MNPGRNDACPCGSGKKFKRCCGASASEQAAAGHAHAPAQAEYQRLGTLFNARRYVELESASRALVSQYPQAGLAWKILSAALQMQGKDALAAAEKAAALLPGDAEAHANLGNALKERKQLDHAAASYRRAVAIKPDFAEAHNNLGIVLKQMGLLDDAVASYRRAVQLNPAYGKAHNNLGIALKDLAQFTAAEASYRQALRLKPDYAEAALNLALLLLSEGRYAEAWPLHEARYAVHFALPKLPFPQWRGEPLAGKSLLICAEQGYGDNIQFSRYAALLKARGASRLTWYCVEALKPLLETAAGIDAVVTDLSVVGTHDYWAFPLSLPLHCATTLDSIPDAVPYLHALPERSRKWQDSLCGTGFKVGLVWQGKRQHMNDHQRSLPGLATLGPLWQVPGVRFFSLQQDAAALQPLPTQSIVNPGQIGDFADTAAIVAQLDLVISVDTAVAHLAGGMGKPCWVLLPATGTDWRWLQSRRDSPWYPGMRLYRQSKPGDWGDVLEELAEALQQQVNFRSAS